MTQRVELHLHTTTSADTSVIIPRAAICAAEAMGLKAVAVTDRNSVQAFHSMQWCRQRYGGDLKIIYGVELSDYKGGDAVVLAKDREGLKALYRLVSGKDIAPEARKHLLIGAVYMQAFLRSTEETSEQLRTLAADFDYFELIADPDPKFGRYWNQKIYKLGKELGIPVVAASNCRCIDPEEAVCVEAVDHCKEDVSDVRGVNHLYTTEELLKHYAYLGEEAAQEVVLTNPAKIADSIERLNPEAGEFPSFQLPDAFEKVAALCDEKLRQFYGQQPPEEIRQRLLAELALLGENASYYLLSHKIVKYLHEKGTFTGTRGTIGSTLIAYLLDISDVNPLPAHYRCAACKYTEFAEGDSGYDLPEKACPHCGAPMAGDGHDIPYETCMGLEGDMRVDIDINVPETIQQEAMEYLAQLLGSDRVAYAGTVSSFQNRLAEAYIRVYAHQTGEDFSGDKFDHMVQTLASVKRGEGRHPGGIVLLPEGMEWEDVTPVRMLDAPECSINKVTHMEFHSIEYVLPKLDLLGYRLLDRLQRLFAATGADPAEINYRDPKVYALFEAGDTYGVPEFSHPFCRGIMKKLEKISFSDLVKVSGMSHGTEVWLGNGACLLQDHPFRELIGDRDDIFRTLRCYGLDPKTAYGVMTATRKGSFGFETPRNLKWLAQLQAAGVPAWYIDSMQRIRYLFPKAHAANYTKLAVTAAWFKVYHPETFYNVTLEDLGAAAFLDWEEEELQGRLEDLEDADFRKDRERDAILLLLEARQRNIPLHFFA